MYSLKFSELIPYSLIACILQPECFKVGCLLPGWIPILPSFLGVPSDPGVSGNHAKSMKIPMSFQYVKKIEKVSRRSPKGVKMRPKTTSPTPNRWIGDKSEILQKPLVLPWFKHIQPLHSGIISIPGSPKRWTWKLSPTLTSQITENHVIVPKVGPRMLQKCTLESIKIDTWPSVSP